MPRRRLTASAALEVRSTDAARPNLHCASVPGHEARPAISVLGVSGVLEAASRQRRRHPLTKSDVPSDLRVFDRVRSMPQRICSRARAAGD
jgi:hypothetical protein